MKPERLTSKASNAAETRAGTCDAASYGLRPPSLRMTPDSRSRTSSANSVTSSLPSGRSSYRRTTDAASTMEV
eukprot:CAMPEP_0174743814 /NCGR_PEP_ID=MMETSP1094-20130205/82606_1 /TAXON_ID=156173 /ORGANISM="Chrysochromulina brevifilum, Strain UTEX LB 985" /LENGTH=72 /DNA_ID=CAMNT_0015948093 /DNA_START=1355 /DNA_END=1569 /DNA_ORIENTATION=-